MQECSEQHKTYSRPSLYLFFVSDQKQPSIPASTGPCANALGMIGVPAKRWTTRADLYRQVLVAREFLDTCDLGQVTVKQVAREAGISLHHFLRLFHEVQGVTPYQYLSKRRIKEAQRLLMETDLPVAHIAAEVGFENHSAFGRAFSREVGVSPRNYRRQNI